VASKRNGLVQRLLGGDSRWVVIFRSLGDASYARIADDDSFVEDAIEERRPRCNRSTLAQLTSPRSSRRSRRSVRLLRRSRRTVASVTRCNAVATAFPARALPTSRCWKDWTFRSHRVGCSVRTTDN